MEILDQSELRDNGKPLETVLSEGYNFNLGDYIGRGFKLFGNDAGSYIGFFVIYVIINFVIGLLPIIGTIGSLFVNPALLGGWFIYANYHSKGQSKAFGNFFDGFKSPHWIQLVLANIITGIFAAVAVAIVVVPFFLSTIMDLISAFSGMDNMQDPEEMSGIFLGLFTGKILLGIFLAILAGSLVAVLYCLAPMFIIFRKMAFWDAMEASRKVVSKNYLQFFLFFVVLIVLIFVGALICLVGLLVAVPVFYLSLYAAYENIMGTGNPETITA